MEFFVSLFIFSVVFSFCFLEASLCKALSKSAGQKAEFEEDLSIIHKHKSMYIDYSFI